MLVNAMIRDIKNHVVSFWVTFFCIIISYMLFSAAAGFTKNDDKKYNYSITCNSYTGDDFVSKKNAKNITESLIRFTRKYDADISRAELLDGTVILIVSKNSKEDPDISDLSYDEISEEMNEGQMCFVVRSKLPLSRFYNDFAEACSENGLTVSVTKHYENNGRKTAFYVGFFSSALKTGSLVFIFILNIIMIYFWENARRHEWQIRYIFGEKTGLFVRQSLGVFSAQILLCFLIFSLIFRARGGSTGEMLIFTAAELAEVYIMFVICFYAGMAGKGLRS